MAGGESLLEADIEAITDDVDRYGARCRVVTNLSLNRPAVLDRLIERNAVIDVSLDAPRQDVRELAYTGARFSLIDRNLRSRASRLARRVPRRRGRGAALPGRPWTGHPGRRFPRCMTPPRSAAGRRGA